ncbi:hypothetical protein [Arenibacter palladensis]|uniref:hypothetical protein n=1 Tax=Arenibacter palladensis TaxID=237373 RepID=UPI0026E34B04|nr:hypothetical protein [Arenibacter palladensis]MDO6603228.1 hypothetical protein [Arenibacter palladensis]
MVNLKSIVKFGFVVYSMLLGFSSHAIENVNQFAVGVNNSPLLIGEENFLGNWKYSAENVPYEYAKGILFISKKDGVLKVVVALRGGERKAQEVKVKDNTLSFNLNLEGHIVSVSINVVGDTISGKASSDDGVFQLTGERRLDPE